MRTRISMFCCLIALLTPHAAAQEEDTLPADESPPGGDAGEQAVETDTGHENGFIRRLFRPFSDEDSGFRRSLNERMDPGWTVRVEPSVWWVSPSGRLRLPGAGRDEVRVERLNLDSPRFQPSGEAEIRSGALSFKFSAGNVSLDRDTVADATFDLGSVDAAPGDRLRIDYRLTHFQFMAGYRFWWTDFAEYSAESEKTVEVKLGLTAIAGLEANDFDLMVEEIGGGRNDIDEFFVHPIVGVRAEAHLYDDFVIDLRLTGGAWPGSNRDSASVDVAVGFAWRPSDHVGLQIGWRQVAYWFSDGEGASEFEYIGRSAGVYAGFTLRF